MEWQVLWQVQKCLKWLNDEVNERVIMLKMMMMMIIMQRGWMRAADFHQTGETDTFTGPKCCYLSQDTSFSTHKPSTFTLACMHAHRHRHTHTPLSFPFSHTSYNPPSPKRA